MLCEKCGALLDDDAVFCDKCGSFVMSGEYSDMGDLECAGKRVRNRSSFWLFFRISAWIIIAAAGIIAAIFGYRYMMNQRVTYNNAPQQSDRIVWGDCCVDVPSLSDNNKSIYYNPYNRETNYSNNQR